MVRPGLAAALAAVLVLCACAGSGPRVQEQGRSRSGGYYLDDGPPDTVPVDLDAIPDAQPRAEPIKVSTTRPYTALGRSFVPMTQLQPYSASGVASWYGRRYHGRPTASGEPYDMFAMSAAHPLLPIPSYVRVTRLDTQRSVVVRINDRGPFLAERLIDLSYAAAYKLGIVGSGQGGVRVDAILPDEIGRAAAPPPGVPASSLPTDTVYLQLGAFAAAANAQALAERARAALPDYAATIGVFEQDGLHRVRTGPFASGTQALQAATRVRALLGLDPVIIGR